MTGKSEKRKIYLGLLLLFGIAVAFCCIFFLWKRSISTKVQDTLFADIDRDGEPEKIELLWKRGRFGKHRPFWVLEDEKGLSQHIFIYDVLEDGELKPLWFASDIGREVVRMKVIGENADTLLLDIGRYFHHPCHHGNPQYDRDGGNSYPLQHSAFLCLYAPLFHLRI